MAPDIVTVADTLKSGASQEGQHGSVTVATERDQAQWDGYVRAQRAACGYHAWNWRRVFESFGHECLYLIAQRAGRVHGVLPLVHISSRLFGRSMTSLPFLNYGGVVADSDAVARGLLESASELARQRHCHHVELRHTARRFEDLPYKQHKVSMRLPLQSGMWEILDRKVRNQIRKAEKSQLTVERGGEERLSEFYAVFSRNMRDLGTPVYAKEFFRTILGTFASQTRLIIVRLDTTPVAAGLTYRDGGTIEIPWASSIRDYNSLCPNHLLYWHAIESAAAEGCATFDFGRSTPHEGTYKFKEQWGSSPVPLFWEYYLPGGGDLPDQSPKNPKFRMMVEAWKRCPLWLANAIGPHIVRSIP
jgi:FemAB-related protein (PEP-CTERM system-associated)